MLDEAITKNSEIEAIDISKHKRQLFGMYGGEIKKVTFIADKSLIDVIFDKFGSQAKIVEAENGVLKCTVEVQVGPMFIAWLCSFGTKIKAVSPPTVVKRVKEHLEDTLSQY
jgi:predicted DNA-binding transcriptional regulator YafY